MISSFPFGHTIDRMTLLQVEEVGLDGLAVLQTERSYGDVEETGHDPSSRTSKSWSSRLYMVIGTNDEDIPRSGRDQLRRGLRDV